MADNYKITQYSVNSILNNVLSSQIAIPEMQRPFVWKGKEVKDLIDSLYEGYPIGYLIIWQNSQVRLRGFGKGGTKKILIDGQQRVTALMAALLGREVLDDQYKSHRIRIAFLPFPSEGEERFAVNDGYYDDRPEWIPDISLLFKKNFSYRTFEKEYAGKNPGLDISGLESVVDQLKGIVKHQVGIIELSFLLDIDVVSEIFIRINLQGKPLNQEDFAMSKISVNEQYDGDRIRNTIDYFCHLLQDPSFLDVLKKNESDFMNSEYGKNLAWTGGKEEFYYKPSYGDMLKVVLIAWFGRTKIADLVNLLSGKTSRRGEVSRKLSEESFRTLGKGVKAFTSEKNFRGFCQALEKAGYTCPRLFYSQSVLNYCYAMYLIMDREGLSKAKKQSMTGRWMTMALITGHYQNSPDSVVMRDCAEIGRAGFASYLSQLEELRLTDQFFAAILPDKFRATNVRTASFMAFLAAMCAADSKGLYSKSVLIKDLLAEKTDSCQLLSRNYLEKCGFKTRETYGQVANITYTSKDVKNVLKKKSPADYRELLGDLMSGKEISASLKEHGIPEEIFTADKDHVEEILSARRENMAQIIKTHYFGL